MIRIGPTGNVVQGDVLDVNKASLEARLKDYDAQLYLKWNPRRRHGYGAWELRRRPDKKTFVLQGTINDLPLFNLEYKERELESFICEMPVLNYSILEYLRKADTWFFINYEESKQHRVSNWIDDLDNKAEIKKQESTQKSYDDAIYELMQHKSALRVYREAILSGVNPAQIAQGWK